MNQFASRGLGPNFLARAGSATSKELVLMPVRTAPTPVTDRTSHACRMPSWVVWAAWGLLVRRREIVYLPRAVAGGTIVNSSPLCLSGPQLCLRCRHERVILMAHELFESRWRAL
jgi:hypothetical protein